jgi:hypothetical protein
MMNTKPNSKRSGRLKKKVKPIKDRAQLRGTKYAIAYMLVAAGELSEAQIAELLYVDVSALQEAMRKRYFQKQVTTIRKSEAILRANSMPFVGCGKMASQMLIATSRLGRHGANLKIPDNSTI